jgi:hypothetical protein
VSRAVVTLEDLMLLVVSADLWATEWLLIWLGLRTLRLEVAPTRVDALERCGVRVLLGRVLEVLMKGRYYKGNNGYGNGYRSSNMGNFRQRPYNNYRQQWNRGYNNFRGGRFNGDTTIFVARDFYNRCGWCADRRLT